METSRGRALNGFFQFLERLGVKLKAREINYPIYFLLNNINPDIVNNLLHPCNSIRAEWSKRRVVLTFICKLARFFHVILSLRRKIRSNSKFFSF